MSEASPPANFPSGSCPPGDYDRAPQFDAIHSDKDVAVAMRDGVKLVIDVYRPAVEGRFPVLLAFGGHSKELQGPDYPMVFPPQPAWSSLWLGHMEAGDTRYFVTRGYVHVIGSPRGMHKSEGAGSREWDGYDLLAWIAQQPWCDGSIGMVGVGAFAAEQYNLAKQAPPLLKAIYPYDGRGAYGPMGGFREEYPGGVIHLFRYVQDHFSGVHQTKGAPGTLSPERERLWQAAMENPDYRMYPQVMNVLAQKGQHMPRYFDVLIDPYDKEDTAREAEAAIGKIAVPTAMGAGWYGYTYKSHPSGAEIISAWSTRRSA